MSESYDRVQAQVILRANQLQADSASALATAYASTAIGATEMADRATEFPATAVNDCILNAFGAIVRRIAYNPTSPYRSFFGEVTASVASGALIPVISSGGKSRVGVLGNVRDASDSTFLTFAPLQVVLGVRALATNILKKAQYLYWADNTRIVHTRTNIVGDLVTFDASDERMLMASSPRGVCRMPQDLMEILIHGSLSEMFRGEFNVAQVNIWRNYFNEGLAWLGPDDTPQVVSKSASD